MQNDYKKGSCQGCIKQNKKRGNVSFCITITNHVYNRVFTKFINGIFASSTVSAATVQYKELVEKYKVNEPSKSYMGTTSITKKKGKSRQVRDKHL